MAISIYFLLVLIPHVVSISFNITNITPQNLNKDILTQKDSYISPTQGIQVTPSEIGSNRTGLAGRAIYNESLNLWDKKSGELASFSTQFSFVIDSNGQELYADGLTFFLSENNYVITGGGAMGLPVNATTYNETKYPFVAVEFDTFGNNPWDPSELIYSKHVGIDVSNLTSVRYEEWFSNVSTGIDCKALIKYDSFVKNLSVHVSDDDDNVVELYYIIDLRDKLPEYVIFGFSASTGDLFEKNSVKSWSLNSSKLVVDEEVHPPAPSPESNGSNSKPPPPPPPPPPSPSQNSEKKKGKGTGLMVGLISIGSIGLLVIVAIFAFYILRRKKRQGDEVEEDAFSMEMNKDFEMGIGPKRFSYHELVEATSGFVEKNKLGEGGFGGVYKGFVKDLGMHVAAKRVSKTSEQGIKEYASEVKIISRLRHKNLVELKGWCHEKGELIVVYEFLENGSLDLHLFKGRSLLTWSTRYKIAHGLASALLYLHHEWEQCVLHRDIKSSNIMLDANFNVKLGDFGLAKLVDRETGAQTTMLAGTLGYMAPEYIATGKASKESDVFSFGVVALEISCGRKAVEKKASEMQIRLIDWVWELYGTKNLLEAVDPRLGVDFEDEEIKRLMTVGLWCVHPDPELRPSMRQVVHVLNSEASLPVLPAKMPVPSYVAPDHGSSSSGVNSNIQNQSSSSQTASSIDSSFLSGR